MSGLSPTAVLIESALQADDTTEPSSDNALLASSSCYQSRSRTIHDPSTLCFRALKNRASDDLLCSVLQLLPFEAALAVCQGLGFHRKSLSRLAVWRKFFDRAGFVLDCCICVDTTDVYLASLHQRHRWLQTLCYGATPVPARWPRSLLQQSQQLLLPHARIFLRRNLVYSTNYLRRNHHRRGVSPAAAVFHVQCASPADSLSILVLERDNEGHVRLSEQSLDTSGLVRKAPVLLWETTVVSDVLCMLPCRHTATESTVVVVMTTTTINDSTTTQVIHRWYRSRATQGRWERQGESLRLPESSSGGRMMDIAGPVVVTTTGDDGRAVLVHHCCHDTRGCTAKLTFDDPIQTLQLIQLNDTTLYLRIVTLHSTTRPWLRGCTVHLYDLSSSLIGRGSCPQPPRWLESKALLDDDDDDKQNQKNNSNLRTCLQLECYQHYRPERCILLASPTGGWWVSVHHGVHYTIALVWTGGAHSTLVAVIHVPLLHHPTPQLHMDHNRLLILGQDHISLILLVYKMDDATAPAPRNDHPHHRHEPRSGGVVCCSDAHSVQFVNRRRPEGDCPVGPSSSLQLSCNERVVLVRVRTVDGEDGIWVLDLDGPFEEEDTEDAFELCSTLLLDDNEE